MPTTIKENKQVLDFVYDFKNIVEKENWVSRYDIDTDSFSFSVRRLPRDARIKYFGNEFAFYMTEDNKIKGIFIEYFKNNFIKHHSEVNNIKSVLKVAEKNKEPDEALVELKMKRTNEKIVFSKIGEAMKESLAENINLKPVSK